MVLIECQEYKQLYVYRVVSFTLLTKEGSQSKDTHTSRCKMHLYQTSQKLFGVLYVDIIMFGVSFHAMYEYYTLTKVLLNCFYLEP